MFSGLKCSPQAITHGLENLKETFKISYLSFAPLTVLKIVDYSFIFKSQPSLVSITAHTPGLILPLWLFLFSMFACWFSPVNVFQAPWQQLRQTVVN